MPSVPVLKIVPFPVSTALFAIELAPVSVRSPNVLTVPLPVSARFEISDAVPPPSVSDELKMLSESSPKIVIVFATSAPLFIVIATVCSPSGSTTTSSSPVGTPSDHLLSSVQFPLAPPIHVFTERAMRASSGSIRPAQNFRMRGSGRLSGNLVLSCLCEEGLDRMFMTVMVRLA